MPTAVSCPFNVQRVDLLSTLSSPWHLVDRLVPTAVACNLVSNDLLYVQFKILKQSSYSFSHSGEIASVLTTFSVTVMFIYAESSRDSLSSSACNWAQWRHRGPLV